MKNYKTKIKQVMLSLTSDEQFMLKILQENPENFLYNDNVVKTYDSMLNENLGVATHYFSKNTMTSLYIIPNNYQWIVANFTKKDGIINYLDYKTMDSIKLKKYLIKFYEKRLEKDSRNPLIFTVVFDFSRYNLVDYKKIIDFLK
jgi:hypothetical protein